MNSEPSNTSTPPNPPPSDGTQPAPIPQSPQQTSSFRLHAPGPGVPGQVRPAEYLVLLAPPRQPGMQRYPFIQLPRHQMMAGPGGTMIQRPALIRGVSQPGVHPALIPGNQSFSLAGGMISGMTAGSPIIHQPNVSVSSPSTTPSQMTPGDALMKGTNFFNSLLTKMNIKSKKTTLQNLIQALIDGKRTSEEFATALQKELNSGPQTQLVPFLDLLLPHLRQSINAGITKLPGIRPPNAQNAVSGVGSQQSEFSSSPIMNTSAPGELNKAGSVTPTLVMPMSATPSTSTPTPMGSQIITSSQTLTPTSSTTPAPKKKKTPLLPGQKSAYAIKKEAREARKREKELAAMGIKVEKGDGKNDHDQKQMDKATKPKADRPKKQDKQRKQDKQLESLSAALRDDDDVNDVAAMGGVNLAEESQKIMASGAELVGTQIRSCKDEAFFDIQALSSKISTITRKFNLADPTEEIVTLVSHAMQTRLKDLVERLGFLAEHRSENLRLDPKYEVSRDVKGQMKFLAELDRIEKRRYEEQERELLMKVAKSRSKVEDPEQQKLRQKAKDMQRAEQEEVRQREANQTALLAIGPRKKAKTSSSISSFSQTSTFSETRKSEIKTDARRMKRVNLRDLQILLELDHIHLDRLVKITS